MLTTVDNVYDWLTEQTGQRLFYTRLLRLAYPPEQLQPTIAVYSQLARLMQSEPTLIQALLRGERGGWRSSVIGNVVVILQRTTAFEDDLAKAIIQGNWAAPQLAAGFALTTQGIGIKPLSEFLGTAREPSPSLLVYPKGILSAYAALKLIGNEKAEVFEADPHFETLKSKDHDDCIDRAHDYYTFWKAVPSID